MLKQFFFAALVALTATVTMSFSTLPTAPKTVSAIKGGGSLTVTNPSSGTINMNWVFPSASSSYTIAVQLLATRQVVRSVTTNQTNYSTSGLVPGTYRCSVDDGNFVIITDIIVY